MLNPFCRKLSIQFYLTLNLLNFSVSRLYFRKNTFQTFLFPKKYGNRRFKVSKFKESSRNVIPVACGIIVPENIFNLSLCKTRFIGLKSDCYKSY